MAKMEGKKRAKMELCEQVFDAEPAKMEPAKKMAKMEGKKRAKMELGEQVFDAVLHEHLVRGLVAKFARMTLDTCLAGDPKSKVACETATKDNMVVFDLWF
jgi:hypothetical protein